MRLPLETAGGFWYTVSVFFGKNNAQLYDREWEWAYEESRL